MKRNGIFFVFALWLLGCSTAQKPVVFSAPKTKVPIEFPPEPQTTPQKSFAAIVLKPQTLTVTFSNADIGPLFYHLEQSLSQGNWTPYASGPAMPGETKVLIEKTNAKAFYRVGWPVR